MDMKTLNQNENGTNTQGLKAKKIISTKSKETTMRRGVLQSMENISPRDEPLQQKLGKKITHKKTFAIFQDSKTMPAETKEKEVTWSHVEVQTEGAGFSHCVCHADNSREVSKEAWNQAANEQARRLMVDDEVPEDYWRQLAETRREALEESLIENEILHTSISELKEENRRLSELAEHAEYFANILKSMTEKSEENENEAAGSTNQNAENQVFDDVTDCSENEAVESTNQEPASPDTDKQCESSD